MNMEKSRIVSRFGGLDNSGNEVIFSMEFHGVI